MTNELDKKIRELESYNDELIKDNNQLRNEIEQLEYGLIYCEEELNELEVDIEKLDKKIIDLDYELFLEKTRSSHHSFYWFTANRRPIISDVSYSNKEKLLYGFKQTPNYKFIEYNDLRFITNCSLDELIEQFR